MAKLTPEQEALYALEWNLPRSDLSMAAQLEYDRLKADWEREGVLPTAEEPVARFPLCARRAQADPGSHSGSEYEVRKAVRQGEDGVFQLDRHRELVRVWCCCAADGYPGHAAFDRGEAREAGGSPRGCLRPLAPVAIFHHLLYHLPLIALPSQGDALTPLPLPLPLTLQLRPQ